MLTIGNCYLATDNAAVDELTLMHAAVRDLEAPHLKVLDCLMQEKLSQAGVEDYKLAQLFPNGANRFVSYTQDLGATWTRWSDDSAEH